MNLNYEIEKRGSCTDWKCHTVEIGKDDIKQLIKEVIVYIRPEPNMYRNESIDGVEGAINYMETKQKELGL
jgi:hypothetical protein